LIPVRLLDVSIGPNAAFEIDVPESHACFVYVYEGAAHGLDRGAQSRQLTKGELAVLEGSGIVKLAAGTSPVQLLFADGAPIREPVARYGPFVMNTRDELVKAFGDYSRGELDQIAI